jgi:hypothetical protein
MVGDALGEAAGDELADALAEAGGEVKGPGLGFELPEHPTRTALSDAAVATVAANTGFVRWLRHESECTAGN